MVHQRMHPFDVVTQKFSMPSLRPDDEPSTVYERYEEELEEGQGGGSSDRSSNSSSTGNSKTLDGKWDGASSFYSFFILRRMGKNKALAHHTSTYFHTRFNSVAFAAQR